MPDEMRIRVCVAKACIKWVNVHSTDLISELRKIVLVESPVFICKGQVLSETNSFAFYGIRDNEAIVILPNDCPDPDLVRWNCLTRDSDRFNERIRSIMDPRTQNEVSRLKDLILFKLERRPRQFQRWCAASCRPIPLSLHEQVSDPISISYIRPDNVSCEPLPVIWHEDQNSGNGFDTVDAGDDIMLEKPNGGSFSSSSTL
jgi:hypothetical protein